MDFTKMRLVVKENMTTSATPVYLVIKGSKPKALLSAPVLAEKRRDISDVVKEFRPEADTGVVLIKKKRVGLVAYPLVKGGFQAVVKGREKVLKLPKDATRVFRVHPNRLSEKQRELICGSGLGGEARRQFIEEGLTFPEQVHRAKESEALRQAEWAIKERAKKKERRNRNRANREKEGVVGKEPAEVPTDAIYNAGHVAKLSGRSPGEIRKFLRSKKIGKRGGRYAFTKDEATKIARAAKKHYRGKES